MAARALILAKYQLPECIRQQRCRSKRAKANNSAEQQMKEMATGRICEGNSVGYIVPCELSTVALLTTQGRKQEFMIY